MTASAQPAAQDSSRMMLTARRASFGTVVRANLVNAGDIEETGKLDLIDVVKRVATIVVARI